MPEPLPPSPRSQPQRRGALYKQRYAEKSAESQKWAAKAGEHAAALAAAQGALRRGREELDAAIEGLCAHSQPMVPRSAIEQWLFPIQAALAAESGKPEGEAPAQEWRSRVEPAVRRLLESIKSFHGASMTPAGTF
jgi:hypothetical protein